MANRPALVLTLTLVLALTEEPRAWRVSPAVQPPLTKRESWRDASWNEPSIRFSP